MWYIKYASEIVTFNLWIVTNRTTDWFSKENLRFKHKKRMHFDQWGEKRDFIYFNIFLKYVRVRGATRGVQSLDSSYTSVVLPPEVSFFPRWFQCSLNTQDISSGRNSSGKKPTRFYTWRLQELIHYFTTVIHVVKTPRQLSNILLQQMHYFRTYDLIYFENKSDYI